MKEVSFLVFLYLVIFQICQGRHTSDGIHSFDPDMLRNVSGLISSKGYPVEEHTVQTEDGFLLGLQRIPHGKVSGCSDERKQAIFLQHGLTSAASDFVLNFAEQSLGFILADAGYDVWLGNTRGNTYSRRHIKYTPRMKEFWDYSFDEMAKYDLPGSIDYILNVTGQKQLYYVGHSQGTTSAFALLSENPKYNEKIKLFIALAPVTTVGYITSAISYIAPFAHDIDLIAELLGVNEFFPSSTFMKFLKELVCDTEEKFICEDVIFLLCGTDTDQLNQTRVGVYAAHSPAGTSTRSIVHYAQLVNSKRFTKYDFGRKENLIRYNQTTPPGYDVSRITAPVALFWSLNDKLADPADVDLMKEKLKSLVEYYCVPLPVFNHLDFVYGIDAHKLLYNEILSLLNKYKE